MSGELEAFVREAGERIRAELSEIHGRVHTQVEDLRGLSERETLAIGSVLSTIVERVQDIVDQGEAELRRSNEEVRAITADFQERISSEAERQEAAVDRVFALAASIGTSIEAIDQLRHSTEMLAINSKIEAARLGDLGLPFSVLAEQIRDLGGSVRATTTKVTEAIENVQAGLPEIAESARDMSSHMQAYVERVQTHVQGQSGADKQEGGRLDEIAQLSNRALSHLGFQDPLVQRLAAIDREVGAIVERVDPLLRGDATVAAQDVQEDEHGSEGGEAATGEILLF
jgi:methyl-accepting chemotaxis protein